MTLTPIESALKNRHLQVAKKLLVDEWNRSAESPAHIYYQVIRDGLVATFQLLESSYLCGEWDSFRYCSNAMLELDVKNVPIPEEMELRVMHKLSAYGLRRLCGDPIKPERSWEDSIDLVVQWVRELRDRPKWYDLLDVDDQVMFRIQLIHNHLFFIKNQPAVRELPLKEIIFCLAIFVAGLDEIQGCELFKIMINKRSVMQFLTAIASRLNAIRKRTGGVHSSVLKKLRKAYRRVKQMHSVFKIIRCSQIYKELDASDYKRCSASTTVAAFKRFNQICGEAIKNTTDTPNLSTKLSNILPNVLTDSIMLNSKYRNFSSHGFPLSHLFVHDTDQIYYYEYLSNFLYMTAASFYVIFVYILHDCTRYTLGLMRRCRTIDDIRALIRYVGSSKVRALQESMFQKIEQYFSAVKNRLSETDLKSLTQAQMKEHDELWENYDQKMEIINNLRYLHRNNLMDVVEVVAFSNASISAVHRLLDSKLTDKSSGSYLETMFSDWKVLTMRSFDSIEFNAVVMQSYIHQYLELDHDSTQQWRYRLKTQEILSHFTTNIDMDKSTQITLEENLHSALSKTRNGYYQNIFALDSKSQAIIQTLKTSITGPKSSKDYKTHNNRFKSQLEALRRQDEQELQQVVQNILLNLRETFQRYDCGTIDKLIENHIKIPLKARLAIEFWQLRTMEILYSSGYLGDNFCLLTKSVPMIWGKSYRNYLAHDSLSYDLLTNSDTIKTLTNGFVLAFNSTELDIFTRPVKFNLDGLVELKDEGFRWLETQAGLLQSIRSCDIQQFESFLDRKAEPSGRYLLALGKLLRPRYYAMPGIITHEQFDCNRIKTVASLLSQQFQNIEEILTTSKINHAVRLNMLQINQLPLPIAMQQIEILQPHLMTPIVGAVLPHLVGTNNITLLETLLDRYAGSNVKPILLMTTGHSEMERGFLATHLGLRTSIISELTDEDLKAIFTEDDYPASEYELGIAIIRNDLRLFEHIVQNCFQTSNSVIEECDMLQAMENCCCYGRLQMVRCLLASDWVCDLHLMFDCLTLAIANHHWQIVDLLYQNGAYVWLNDGVHVLSLLTEENFKMVRKILEDGIPNHLAEKFISWVVQFGSKRLLKHLVDKGVDIWRCEDILEVAVMNKDAKVLNFLESMIFVPSENASSYAEFRRWIKILHDLRALMLISIQPDFIKAIIPTTSIAERWIDQIANLLKMHDNQIAKYFHFEDPSGLHCSKLVNESQFKRTLLKCTTLVDLIQSVLPGLIVERTTLYIEFRTPNETIEAEVDLAIYSTIAPAKSPEVRTTILTQDYHHTADIISMGLRTFLLRFRHLKAATATVSKLNSSERFHYIQVDSNSCIVQLAPQESINLSYLLNKPGQSCVLHYLQPNSSPHLVESLLRLGADPALQNGRFATPFRTVLATPFPLGLIKLMYQHYEKSHHHHDEMHVFNIKDMDGYTPLHAAIGTNNYEVTEFFLQYGADPTQADQTGEAAVLEYAIFNRNVRIVDLLLRHSPDLVKQYSNSLKRSTALESAVKINHDHIVRMLLECGADLNHRNKQLFTALKYVIEQESVESLQVMLDYAHREGVIVDGDVDGCGTMGLQLARQLKVCPEITQLLVCHSIKSVALSLVKLRD
ncbi:uncharacterized protein LOC135712770 [Ochlerotatus camptorhynchus]|uniref:uncharacterized protein LOC135712770 n=1 Tax=Ochlerotatus camptorhynchus TaxID=644619 RepID=UPI0031DDA713